MPDLNDIELEMLDALKDYQSSVAEIRAGMESPFWQDIVRWAKLEIYKSRNQLETTEEICDVAMQQGVINILRALITVPNTIIEVIRTRKGDDDE